MASKPKFGQGSFLWDSQNIPACVGHRVSESRGCDGIGGVGCWKHHDGVAQAHIPNALVDADRVRVDGTPGQGGRHAALKVVVSPVETLIEPVAAMSQLD